MKLVTGQLYITDYQSNDIKKVRFVRGLKNDPLIQKYVSLDIEEVIKLSEGLKRLCVGAGFIIGKDDDYIGAIKISNLTREGYLNYDCMIHEKYRNSDNHYGSVLALEVTDFLMNYFLFIRGVEIAIDRKNSPSIKIAKNAGFEFKRKSPLISNMDIYVKNRK